MTVSRARALATALLAVACAVAWPAAAHESRPAYLQLGESAPGRWEVLWRTPLRSGMPLPVSLQLPDGVRDVHPPSIRQLSDSLLESRMVEPPPGGLGGARIEFVGLQATITDVLVRVTTLDGGASTTLVRPSQPWVEVASQPGPLAVAGTYVGHGIEHILSGYDHLLFVAALLLLVRSLRVLLVTISSFTVAHSITLALAALGVVEVPGPPVEASIALSIVLLASEIVRARGGETSLTARSPWLVAFCFGLLHGFGFASVLTSVGLPQSDLPLALLSFNVGVEIGQLLFIGVLLGAASLAARSAGTARAAARVRQAAPWAIGVIAAFWFCDRLSGFMT